MTIDRYTNKNYAKISSSAAGTGNMHVTNNSGILHTVMITTSNQNHIKIYDNDSTTGTLIASINSSVALGTTLHFDCVFVNGLSLFSNSISGMTVTYSD